MCRGALSMAVWRLTKDRGMFSKRRLTRNPAGRTFLTAGFGGLLVLMLLAGGYALGMFERVRSSDAQERDMYLRRARALESVRAGIYQSAIVMRDYLLAPDPASAGKHFDEWTEIRHSTDQALAECANALDPAETVPFRNLQGEIQVYWKLLDFITELPPENKHIHGAEFLSKEVVRHRTTMLKLVDSINQIDSRQMAEGDAKLNATFRGLRLRLMVMLAATVGVGLLLAVFTIRRTLRLEEAVEQRYHEVVRARSELQDLSARLVSAQEEERRTISRELHDEVGQSLSALLMEAGNAAAANRRTPQPRCAATWSPSRSWPRPA